MSLFQQRILKFLQPLLLSKSGKQLIVWTLLNMNFSLPISRLYESENLLAFFHPQPTYPFHVLITPKEKIPNFLALDTENSFFLMEVNKVAQKIITDYQLDQSGYRLIVNGGNFQDFPLLHFHLISDKKPSQAKELS